MLLTPFSLALAEESAADAVKAFNAAVTARDMDTAMSYLADGAVQIQLRAVHPGMPENPPLTADLAQMWKAVAAILFPVSSTYDRTVEITDQKTLGEVSTVWTVTSTHTLSKKEGKAPLNNEFSEVYMMVNKGNGWKIAAVADNRGTDETPVN